MRWILVLGLLAGCLAPRAAHSEAIPVELVQLEDGQWQLLRGGEPFRVRGAGGDASKEQLVAAGGNSFRTWAVGPELGEQLDRAHELGLAVVVGHWLGHPRHGFDYNDLDMVSEQFARVRRDVMEYRDHPALLLWAIGNEMEGYEAGDNAAIWSHVQALAAMIHDLDPNHPTMTVTAELGGERVRAVHALCPDIDILGINSYGGLPSVPERYRELGGTKPYVVTEFGPPGTWEVGRTAFGAPPELTSTEKAEVYRDAYTAGCLDAPELCLGGFAFAWGWKMEATRTWFGMFLPNGDKLAAVDAMTRIWTGEPPANLCPEIRSFDLRGPDVVQPGDTVQVDVEVVDPEGAEVELHWEVTGEASKYITGGDRQPVPLLLDGILTASSSRGATLVMPGGGTYRVYMTASDGQGGGAAANVPIHVEGPVQPVRLKLPLAVHADGEPGPWAPSGWMGTHTALSMDDAWPDQPRSGETSLRFHYDAPNLWAGVAWQHPANDWGEEPGGFDLSGARELSFWARGDQGGEVLDFGVGLLGSDKPFPDSARVQKKGVELGREWKRYRIELDGEDLSRIKTPFVWTLAGQGRPVTFYLDDIRFE